MKTACRPLYPAGLIGRSNNELAEPGPTQIALSCRLVLLRSRRPSFTDDHTLLAESIFVRSIANQHANVTKHDLCLHFRRGSERLEM